MQALRNGLSSGGREPVPADRRIAGNLSREYRHLILADQHLAEGRKRTADLIAHIQRMTRQGHDTTVAEDLLRAFEEALVQWEGHRSIILDALSRRDRAAADP